MLRQGIATNISSQRNVVDTFHRASKLKWSFLVLVVRLDHLVHEGGAVGWELLTRGGAVGGGQVEEGVHLVAWGVWFSQCTAAIIQILIATMLSPSSWDSCSSTSSGRGGRRRRRTLPGWTLTRWTLSWKITHNEDVETYQVSSSVQSRKATSTTVSRPGIWLADSRKN